MKCNGVQLSSLELGSITLHLPHDMDVLLAWRGRAAGVNVSPFSSSIGTRATETCRGDSVYSEGASVHTF